MILSDGGALQEQDAAVVINAPVRELCPHSRRRWCWSGSWSPRVRWEPLWIPPAPE